MTCSAPTGTTKGILIAYDSTDTGDRPLAANIPFYITPNIRLAQQADIPALSNPANWDTAQYAGWNGQVDTGSAYSLLVRVRNTDTTPRASLNLQGWVSDYTAGGVGPGSAILNDPTQAAGPGNPAVSFTGFNNGPLAAANPANPNDPASMLVLVSDSQPWTPNAKQLTVNGGHVCVAVNVYADETTADYETPADGQPLVSSFLDPACDRMYGQRNIQIVAVQQGRQVQVPLMLVVPATDRCPLNAAVAIRPVELKTGPGGVLPNVPELGHLASTHAIEALRPPGGDPLGHVRLGGDGDGHGHGDGDGDGDGNHNGQHHGDGDGHSRKIHLEPGQRTNFMLTLDARNHRPGDAYAVDVLTTDTATNRLFGAARVYALVTG